MFYVFTTTMKTSNAGMFFICYYLQGYNKMLRGLFEEAGFLKLAEPPKRQEEQSQSPKQSVEQCKEVCMVVLILLFLFMESFFFTQHTSAPDFFY